MFQPTYEQVVAFAKKYNTTVEAAQSAINGRTGLKALTDDLTMHAIGIFGSDGEGITPRDIQAARRVRDHGENCCVPSDGVHPAAVSRLLTAAGIQHTREERMFGPFWPNPSGYPGELISKVEA